MKTVESGEAALEAYKSHEKQGEPFDAIILDLTVPGGMGGKETLIKLLEINPRAQVIATSGYSHDPVMARPLEFGFADKIEKPFRRDELAKILERLVKRSA